MNEEVMQQMAATAEKLAGAAQALEQVLGRLDAQQEALNAKVERIVAAIEELPADTFREHDPTKPLSERIAELEKANTELKAQATRAARKTLSPVVATLLGKYGSESDERIDPAVLDKTLAALSVDQRIAVKAEMARAGLLE